MTAASTATSRTVSTTMAPRPLRLRLRRTRLRRARVNAANSDPMTSKRKMRTGPQRPVRIFSSLGGFAAAIALAAASLALPAPAQAQTTIVAAGAQGISDFYAARQGRPLWFSQDGRQV